MPPPFRSFVEEIYIRTGAQLRVLRRNQGLTLAVVGERMGADGTTLTMYELGKRRMSMHVFCAFCRAVGADPVEVLVRVLDEMGDGV